MDYIKLYGKHGASAVLLVFMLFQFNRYIESDMRSREQQSTVMAEAVETLKEMQVKQHEHEIRMEKQSNKIDFHDYRIDKLESLVNKK